MTILCEVLMNSIRNMRYTFKLTTTTYHRDQWVKWIAERYYRADTIPSMDRRKNRRGD